MENQQDNIIVTLVSDDREENMSLDVHSPKNPQEIQHNKVDIGEELLKSVVQLMPVHLELLETVSDTIQSAAMHGKLYSSALRKMSLT